MSDQNTTNETDAAWVRVCNWWNSDSQSAAIASEKGETSGVAAVAAGSVLTPHTDAAFAGAKVAAAYCYGADFGARGWRDIACAMRDESRKQERMARDLGAREVGEKVKNMKLRAALSRCYMMDPLNPFERAEMINRVLKETETV